MNSVAYGKESASGPPLSRLSRWQGRLVALGFAVVLLGLMEAAARLLYRPPVLVAQVYSLLRQDPELLWTLRAGRTVEFQGTQVVINSLGFRGPEVPLAKPPGTFRVVCMGASPTFGWGVAGNETYPAVLQSRLQDAADGRVRVEVVNAGVIGYTSHQGCKLLARTVCGLDPDLVTVSYLVNEPARYRFYRNTGGSDRELREGSRFVIAVEGLLYKSRLVAAAKALGGGGKSTAAGSPGGRRVAPDDYQRNLAAIVRSVRVLGSEVVLIRMPVNPRPVARDPLLAGYVAEIADYVPALERVAKAQNVPLVDAAAALQNRGKPGTPLFINPDSDLVHPSAYGNRIIAEAICEAIVERDSLAAAPGSRGREAESGRDGVGAGPTPGDAGADRSYAEAQTRWADSLMTLERHAEAAEHYRKAVDASATHLAAHNGLGIALKRLGRFREAEASFRNVLRLDPDHATVHGNLGIVLQEQGKTAEAVAHFRRSLELDPSNPGVHNNLGVALASMGKKNEALDCFRAALRIDPGNADAQANLDLLEKDR